MLIFFDINPVPHKSGIRMDSVGPDVPNKTNGRLCLSGTMLVVNLRCVSMDGTSQLEVNHRKDFNIFTSHFKTSFQSQSLRLKDGSDPTLSERVPGFCVGSRRPILEIAYYYCGCPPRSALILNLIEGFEMACSL